MIVVADVTLKRGGEVLFGAGSVSEESERSVEGAVGYVVALGPVLPRGEGLDVDLLFADEREHGVEAVDGAAGAELFVVSRRSLRRVATTSPT